ncbi:MAG: hypothetical protein WBA17_07635 [Saprospiraceae bacterium]
MRDSRATAKLISNLTARVNPVNFISEGGHFVSTTEQEQLLERLKEEPGEVLGLEKEVAFKAFVKKNISREQASPRLLSTIKARIRLEEEAK